MTRRSEKKPPKKTPEPPPTMEQIMIQYPAAEWTIEKYRRKTEQMSSSQKVTRWVDAGMSQVNGYNQGWWPPAIHLSIAFANILQRWQKTSCLSELSFNILLIFLVLAQKLVINEM